MIRDYTSALLQSLLLGLCLKHAGEGSARLTEHTGQHGGGLIDYPKEGGEKHVTCRQVCQRLDLLLVEHLAVQQTGLHLGFAELLGEVLDRLGGSTDIFLAGDERGLPPQNLLQASLTGPFESSLSSLNSGTVIPV